ncbi:MAG: NAD-dependent deacylase [Phycisphaerales bacterium]|nr:NAD-dependent deacylase [Phycisphaerales bacterium]
MNAILDEHIRTLAAWLKETTRGVAFSGAGISTESGIPDFRSPGGVWSRHQPVMYQDFLTDPAERRRYWQIRKESIPSFLSAEPNAGHLALAKLEDQGHLAAVVTQNIDELHQRAGSRRVLEVHGTAMKVHCLECDKRFPCEAIQDRLEAGEEDICCDDCGGIVKSMTVSFGQQLPAAVWMESEQLCRQCDLFMALGSSLVVYPAAGLPETAKRRGAKLVIVNRDSTPLDDLADLVIHGSIGETLSAVLKVMGQADSR